jgi:transcriptional regulator with XRE-family HTH domain
MQQRTQRPHERLREARIKADLSQTAAAEQLGVSQALVSKIEAAERTPGRKLAIRIREAFGIPYEAWP